MAIIKSAGAGNFLHLLTLACALVLNGSPVLGSIDEYSEQLLRRDLLRHYDPAVHPDRVRLTFSVVFDGCPILDERSGRLSSHLFLSHSWRDSRLVWMPEDYGDIRAIRLSPSDIWTPGVRLQEGKPLAESDEPQADKLTVTSSGSVHWTRAEDFSSDCDRAERAAWQCQFSFVSWKYAGDEFRLVSAGYQQEIVDSRCPGMQAETSIEKVGLGSSSFYYYNVQLTVE